MSAKVATISERLKEIMKLRGKRATDISNDLGIPKSSLSEYISGKNTNMYSQRFGALCKYFKVNEAWLMGYDVPMEPTVIDNDQEPHINSIAIKLDSPELKEEATVLLEIFGNMDENKRQHLLNYASFLGKE